MRYLSNIVTLELDSGKCTGCGMCVDVCPHAVFALEGRQAVISRKDNCMECGACVQNCAFGALSVDKGVGCAAAVINSMKKGGEPACGCSGDEPGTDSCC